MASQASGTPSGSALPNAFGRMMGPAPVVQSTAKRDRCNRPQPEYNNNYNSYEKLRDDLRPDYSPFEFGEPLFDDRPIIIARLPRLHTAASASKKPRTAWVWKLGYALTDNSKSNKPTIWAFKHCTYVLPNNYYH